METIPYRFYITGRSGTREAFPKNGNALAIKWQSENENAYLRKRLTGKILFTNEDFDFLYYLEKSTYRCDAVDLRIENICSGEYQPFISSKLIFSKGTWDIDKRTLEIEPSVLDLYTCYDDNSDIEYNLFSYVSGRFVTFALQGEVETIICNSDGQTPWCGQGDPYSQGYTVLSQYTEYNSGPSNSNMVTTVWVREVKMFTTTPPEPWVNIGLDLYAKPPVLFNYQFTNSPNSSYYSYDYGPAFDNGLSLKSVFKSLLEQTCYGYTLRSDFFQWNPRSVNNINYVTGNLSKVNNLILYQKSDIKRPGANNNATIATISLSDLLKDICNIFNLKWWIDEANNFNIEHVSFNTKVVGLDSATRYDSNLRYGTNKYSYDNDSLPRKEEFTWMDKTYADFAGLPILYNNSCAGLGDINKGKVSISNITTDIQFLLQNPASDSNLASDDGFCLVACDDSGSIITESPILPGSSGNVLNNTLAWSHLHLDYWVYNRPFHQFVMNGQLTNAKSVKATKKQSGLTFKLCCNDSFNPDELVSTPLGNGQIDNPSFNLYKQQLTLDLLYEADISLNNNVAPVAINDDVITFVNLPIIIDVLANDTDSDGTIANQTLSILLNPSNGNAEITPDFKIKYTPNSGFTGSDIIIYRVSDNLQEPSNNGIVNITIKPGSPLPIANNDNYLIAKNRTLTISANGVLINDTGDGAISALPETKNTTAGGNVVIYGNGSFVYIPANDYTGPDSFNYTIKDSNDNEATGTVNISVFEPQPVYVKMVHSNQRTEDILEDCRETDDTTGGGIPIGGIGENQKVGEQTFETVTVYFYADAAGAIPLNVTGYGFKLLILLSQVYQSGPPSNSHLQYDVSGVSMVISEDFLLEYSYNGCDDNQNNNTSSSLELEASPDYQII